MNRRLRKILLALAAVALLVAGAWYLIWLARYPKAPDPWRAELKEAVDFLAKPDFNNLTESHRRKFVSAVIERHRDMSFKELLERAMDRSDQDKRREMVKNVRNLPGHEELGSKMIEMFLDKFYALPEDERTQYLTMIAMAENARMAQRAKQRGLPDPTKLQKEMTRFMSNNSPQTQAKMGQFMMDMKRVRKMWGLKEPI